MFSLNLAVEKAYWYNAVDCNKCALKLWPNDFLKYILLYNQIKIGKLKTSATVEHCLEIIINVRILKG